MKKKRLKKWKITKLRTSTRSWREKKKNIIWNLSVINAKSGRTHAFKKYLTFTHKKISLLKQVIQLFRTLLK